ncbi:neuraminidase-like domain-containing protein [Haloferax sp. DFSO52]|uniref:Tc toxin subunit A-related protein n=1 Tax=Haloferax sp. DFSO52 TaxID=3388505 RepID=UPI003A86043F
MPGPRVDTKSCTCKECDSAVSPRAYLAELLDFINQRVVVVEGGTERALSINELDGLFHQRISELPASCKTTEQVLRQVRLCIEVLRRELRGTTPSAALTAAEEAYRHDAYAALLERLGTTEDELREVRNDEAEREVLAKNLGIDENHFYSSDLSEALGLLLDRDMVTEANLEQLFGLVDTTRAVRNEELEQLEPSLFETWQREYRHARWHEEDMPTTPYDPDRDPSDGDRRAVIDPDIVGPDDMRDTSSSSAVFQLWVHRREWVDEHLRELRRMVSEEVSVDDLLAHLRTPVRYPLVDESTVESRQPWSAPLSAEVDRLTSELSAGDDAILEGALERLDADWKLTEEEFRYIVTLLETEAAHTRDPRNDAVTTAQLDELCSLLVEILKRTMETIWVDEEDNTSTPVYPEGGRDTLTLDPRLFWPSLREPEQGNWPLLRNPDIPIVDPDDVALEEIPEFEGSDEIIPDECENELSGDGGPPISNEQLHTMATDLSTARTTARLWCARKVQLERALAGIEAVYREASAGEAFDVILTVAFGDGAPPRDIEPTVAAASWEDLLVGWKENIDQESPDDSDSVRRAREAREGIEDLLQSSVEEFERLVSFRARADPTEGRSQPSEAEWETLFDTLLVKHKQLWLWPDWLASEDTIPYWRLRKAQLPKWRASATRRSGWQRALEMRSRPPIVDPDRVGREEFFEPLSPPGSGTPTEINPGLVLWDVRNPLSGRIADLKADLLATVDDTVPPGATPAERLDVFVQLAVGIPLDELGRLEERRQSGFDVRPRLGQLSLSRRAFHALLEYRKAVERGEDLSEDWDAVYNIGTQVLKTRLFTVWNDEERQSQEFFLGPPWFTVDENVTIYPHQEDDPMWWRIDRSVRRNWENILESRIEEEEAAVEALREVVNAVEEETLPSLRDALVQALPIPTDELDPVPEGDNGLGARAEWVTDHFLIDAAESGCRETTRVAQAIESLQTLVFNVRAGESMFARNGLKLDIRNSGFDKSSLRQEPSFERAWEWLRSYPTWKSAVAMHLYTENFLHPTLRSEQTPAFKELVNTVGAGRSLSAKAACHAAQSYSNYLYDVGILHPEATCWATAPVVEGEACERRIVDEREYLYIFARASLSDSNLDSRIYWSRYRTAMDQTYWQVIPALENMYQIIGAAPYNGNIYVFARSEPDSGSVVYLIYNIYSDTWGSPEELELPNSAQYSVALIQKDRGIPELALVPTTTTTGDHGLPVSNLIRAEIDTEGGGWTHSGWGDITFDKQMGPFVFGDQVYRAVEMNDGVCLITRFSDQKLQTLKNYWESSRGWYIEHFDPDEDPDSVDVLSNPLDQLELDGVNGNITAEFMPNNQSSILTHVAFRDEEIHEYEGIFYPRYSKPVSILEDEDGFFGAFGYSGSQSVYAFNRNGYTEIRRENSESEQFPEHEYNYLATPTQYSYTTWTRPNGRMGVHSGGYTSRPSRNYLPIKAIRIDRSRLEEYTWTVNLWQYIRLADGNLEFTPPISVSPRFAGSDATSIPESFSDEYLDERRTLIREAFQTNSGRSIDYVKEAYYFVPVFLALRLQRSGEYEAALRWFRTVYDYGADPTKRKMYYGLVDEEDSSALLTRDETWLEDPRDVHGIAATRQHAYTRYTLLSVIGCLLDYADSRFTQDTSESTAQARTLYMTALNLLEAPELKQIPDPCRRYSIRIYPGVFGGLTPVNWDSEWFSGGGDQLGPKRELVLETPVLKIGERWATIAEINGVDTDVLSEEEAAGEVHRFLDEAAPTLSATAKRVEQIDGLKNRKSAIQTIEESLLGDTNIQLTERVQTSHETATHAVADAESQTVGDVVGELSDRASNEFRSLTVDPEVVSQLTVAKAVADQRFDQQVKLTGFGLESDGGLLLDGGDDRTLISDLYRNDESEFRAYIGFCLPPNPILAAFRLRAALNLYKLRNCMNIAGMRREMEPYAAPLDIESSLPTLGPNGQLRVPTRTSPQPSQYRYSALVARSKELVGLAQQVESNLLAALVAHDQEAYSRRKARQDMQTARANMKLQTFRVKEAEEGVDLADIQEERADAQFDYYEMLVQENWLDEETLALMFLYGSAGSHLLASAANFYTGSAAGGLSEIAASLSGLSSYFSMLSQYRRRDQEWENQLKLTRIDQRIAGQQTRIAEAHVRVVEQEQDISKLQYEHADEIVEFLNTKFTNVELYDWMAGVLGDVYRYLLQQATANAHLAVSQLAFERQEAPLTVIQDDYWEAPQEGQIQTLDGEGTDRRGLTGSARLLQDLYRLDQHAFETDERNLQLTKTFSLATQYPYEFQRFRETGVLTFDTPMEAFDRDFPGHYLRLIKRVRTSVLALVPPTEGIKATLSNGGVSRVVTQGPPFQERVIRRTPESVALTSARDATGLFELQPNPDPDKLLPFEGTGVDTRWELRMPKAANQFDYDSIANVLVTVEYTALDSAEYRQQVFADLDPDVSFDRAFSLRREFADQWFDLHNSDSESSEVTVSFRTDREDFSPNLDNLRMDGLLLYTVAAETDEEYEDELTAEAIDDLRMTLSYVEAGETQTVGGTATPRDGVVSTGRVVGGVANAPDWSVMTRNKSPVGEWMLSLTIPSDSPLDVHSLFADERIDDILFVVSFSGRTPAWPNDFSDRI